MNPKLRSFLVGMAVATALPFSLVAQDWQIARKIEPIPNPYQYSQVLTEELTKADTTINRGSFLATGYIDNSGNVLRGYVYEMGVDGNIIGNPVFTEEGVHWASAHYDPNFDSYFGVTGSKQALNADSTLYIGTFHIITKLPGWQKIYTIANPSGYITDSGKTHARSIRTLSSGHFIVTGYKNLINISTQQAETKMFVLIVDRYNGNIINQVQWFNVPSGCEIYVHKSSVRDTVFIIGSSLPHSFSNEGYVIALEDGVNLLWERQLSNNLFIIGGLGIITRKSSIAANSEMVFALNNQNVTAFLFDGTPIWSYNITDYDSVNNSILCGLDADSRGVSIVGSLLDTTGSWGAYSYVRLDMGGNLLSSKKYSILQHFPLLPPGIRTAPSAVKILRDSIYIHGFFYGGGALPNNETIMDIRGDILGNSCKDSIFNPLLLPEEVLPVSKQLDLTEGFSYDVDITEPCKINNLELCRSRRTKLRSPNSNSLFDTNNEIAIAPNPVSGETIVLQIQEVAKEVAVYDILGNIVYSTESPVVNNQAIVVPVQDLLRGTYIVRVGTENGFIFSKFIISR